MAFEDMQSTVSGVLRSCDRYGDLPAVGDDVDKWTYAELRSQILAATRAFMASGIGHGDRVGLCASNSARWIVAALGIQGAGAVLVPLNTRFKGEELAYILGTSGAVAVVSEELESRQAMVAAAHVPLVVERWLAIDDADQWAGFLAHGAAVSEVEALERIEAITADDFSDILFTSGTTGYPKGVPFTHGQSLRAYGELGEGFGYTAGDRFLLIPPFFHALGYKSGWFAGLLHGSLILPERRFDSRHMLERIADERVTIMIGPPTIFAELLDHPDRGGADLSSLRMVVPSATNVSPELVRRMRTELGVEVLTGYGLTESSAVVTYSRAGDDPELVADSVGRPAPGVEVTIVDDHDNPVPTGEQGNIMVSGYVVTRGYWQDPSATADAITAEGRLRTGDVGSLDERGFLRITGRKKDLILVGGFNVYPAEVERLLAQYAAVAEVAVVGVPDNRLGEVPFAFVVPAADATFDIGNFLAWARGRMANFKAPRRAEIVSELPKNASMKVMRSTLRSRAEAYVAGNRS